MPPDQKEPAPLPPQTTRQAATATKPPLGVMPREMWQEKVVKERVTELLGAITRYSQAGLPANPKWIEELQGLMG